MLEGIEKASFWGRSNGKLRVKFFKEAVGMVANVRANSRNNVSKVIWRLPGGR